MNLGHTFSKHPPLGIHIISSLKSINSTEWNALIERIANGNPFLRYEFFQALHDSDCCSERTGWDPQFITLWENERLIGILPLYIKHHSYGEYIFDWAWADAFHYQGLRYYPKLVSAIPFTPVTGSRLIAATAQQRHLLLDAAINLTHQGNFSSLHCLFPTLEETLEMQQHGFMSRLSVQFHWQNKGYRHFDDFLCLLSHDKRKKIKQERRHLKEKNISFHHLQGTQITAEDWAFFTRCYQNTYWEHQSTPYLNLNFFKTIGATMPENILLIMVKKDNVPIASALNFYHSNTLFGRYWGSVLHVPGLHFETCYYQAIEFCIKHKLSSFEGGAQGEHKLARGLLPTQTWSTHWVTHPQLATTIEKLLKREKQGIERYINELHKHSPFKITHNEKG